MAKKKRNLKKLIYDAIFQWTGQNIKETMQLQERWESLQREGLVETLAKNCGFPPESVWDGTFMKDVTDEDFLRELDKIKPMGQRGRPSGLTQEVKDRREIAKALEGKLDDLAIADRLKQASKEGEHFEDYHVRNDRRAEKKANKKM